MNSNRSVVGVSLAVALGLLAGACGSSATSAGPSATTDSVDSVTTSSTQPPVTQAPIVDEVDPTELFVDFAMAWDASDWESVGYLATPNVVKVAMEWYEQGGNATENLALALENGCLDVFDTGMTCQFVYAPPAGRGLIFNVTYGTSDAGLIVTDLVFGGDAG